MNTLRVTYKKGDEDLAYVYVACLAKGGEIEFVESIQPPLPREQKWVLIVSSLRGCPISCPICDAGGDYQGRLSADEILAQIDYLIRARYPDGKVPIPKLKIQFARLGDPALNDDVLDVLERLPELYDAPGTMPCISTIAPCGRDDFFERLLRVKDRLYPEGKFQMQFSMHTTDERLRNRLIPTKIWSFEQIADYGSRFVRANDRKIALNFATPVGFPLEASELIRYFDPRTFLIKLTPVNPTLSSRRNGLTGLIDPANPDLCESVAAAFKEAGYETILSIGEPRENEIGSNCGMYLKAEMPGRA